MGATDPGSKVREGGTADDSGAGQGDSGAAEDVSAGAAAAAAGGFPPVPPPPVGFRGGLEWAGPGAGSAFAPVQVEAGKPRSRGGLYISLAVAGFLVIAAGTAGSVVALGSPQGGPASAQAAAAPASAVPSPSASATAPATTAPVVVPTVAPSPTASVKGWVNDGSHTGDLRFFLLPIPANGQPINDTTGTLESLKQLSQEMESPSQGLTDLKSWSCTGGAIREYRSSDGTLVITTELLHFADGSDAAGWFSGFSFTGGKSFSVPQVPDSKGWAFAPSGGDSYGSVHGYGYDGDVMYEIDIVGPGNIPHSDLIPLMQRERKLLSTGH